MTQKQHAAEPPLAPRTASQRSGRALRRSHSPALTGLAATAGLCALALMLSACSAATPELRTAGAVSQKLPDEMGSERAAASPGSATSSEATADNAAELSDFPAFQIGDCVSAPDPSGNPGFTITPCKDEHAYEIYATHRFPKTSYPGQTELDLLADEQCEDAFADYVGHPYAGSEIEFAILAPSEQEWLFGDRELICVLDSNGASGSLQQANR